MAKKLDEMSYIEKVTDPATLIGGGIWGDKYNEWLDKSDKKVNPKSFASKFLKVSFWISTFIVAICLFFLVANSIGDTTTGARLEVAQTQDMLMCLLLIPLPFVLAIKVLRNRYYGLYKLLWLFPIVLWAFIGLALVAAISEETMEQIVDFIAKIFNLS